MPQLKAPLKLNLFHKIIEYVLEQFWFMGFSLKISSKILSSLLYIMSF